MRLAGRAVYRGALFNLNNFFTHFRLPRPAQDEPNFVLSFMAVRAARPARLKNSYSQRNVLRVIDLLAQQNFQSSLVRWESFEALNL